MRLLNTITLLCFWLLCILCAANEQISTYTSQRCITAYGTKKHKFPIPQTTRSTTRSFTQTAVSVATRTVTRTPLATTSTETQTETATSTTTPDQHTDTAYETTTTTSTETETDTEHETSTSTTTTTSTSTPPTVVVRTSSGFTPIASNSLVIASGGGMKKRSPRARVTGYTDSRTREKVAAARGNYPREIVCVEVVDIVTFSTKTRTQKPPSTTFAPTPTVSTTVTSTTTSITTSYYDDATTTITDHTSTTTTVLTTMTLTETTTSTTTTTEIAAPSKTYEMCQANNIITSVGGHTIRFIDNTGVNATIYSNVKGGTQCCQFCADSPGCGGFDAVVAPYQDCELAFTSTCSPSAYVPGYGFYTSDIGGIVAVGNANCGQIRYLGSF